jgi:uncharacterized protein VirK/YbjX
MDDIIIRKFYVKIQHLFCHVPTVHYLLVKQLDLILFIHSTYIQKEMKIELFSLGLLGINNVRETPFIL